MGASVPVLCVIVIEQVVATVATVNVHSMVCIQVVSASVGCVYTPYNAA